MAKDGDKGFGDFSSAPTYLGHRERLRDRFSNGGADAMPDYELLEMVLFRAIKRGDTKPLAKAVAAMIASGSLIFFVRQSTLFF